ncbi:hypothetical protein P872_01560 [Rhodonellum psychrophilum GCM71 = DSM 17998]|uniref:PglD N-terminal domain-containing protein n=2 Tax=Rhodonellum TaxID=336827 RepID=U5BTN3_9BACT|nr:MULTISPECIES: acetyltransferase [Rhodonellum]ERM83975.1 hypothetical protein P872_01560 [Rhodonellum psychrophilum GCM71 = DSM 17998]SDZ05846.1 sugar O-acyltransferase, sialic acid O-acetyltransferase NeuD family [Rhodonellum ikkaensis]
MTGDIKDVIIIGTGGHSAELDDYIYFDNEKRGSINKLHVKGFLDDDVSKYHAYKLSAPFLGTISAHKVDHKCCYLIGIANLQFRKSIIERFLIEGAEFISFVHPDAYISRSAKIGIGVVIAPNVTLGPNTEIGDFTMVNSRCSIGHDSKVGKYNFLSPNVCLSGNTIVGDENMFGINAATIPAIEIGNRNKIMAGMTISQSVKDDEVVFYRFKERIIAIQK